MAVSMARGQASESANEGCAGDRLDGDRQRFHALFPISLTLSLFSASREVFLFHPEPRA